MENRAPEHNCIIGEPSFPLLSNRYDKLIFGEVEKTTRAKVLATFPPHSNRYDNLSFREVKNESQAKDLVTFSPLSNRYDKLNLGEVLMKLMLKVVSLHLEALRCVSAWPLWFPGVLFSLFFKNLIQLPPAS